MASTMIYGSPYKPHPRRPHSYQAVVREGYIEWSCACGKVRNDAKVKQGRNNRSRGNRAELDIARTYGGQKVGPLGLPEDIRGTQWRTQVKIRQSAPPKMWTDEFRKLDGQRDGRSTRLILRFTRQGGLADGRSEDFIVIRGKDWLEHWGRDD